MSATAIDDHRMTDLMRRALERSTKTNEGQRKKIDALTDAVFALVRRMEQDADPRAIGHRALTRDHACSLCCPGDELAAHFVGFRCAYHAAKQILADAGRGPHAFVAGVNGACARCGCQEREFIHTPAAPAAAGETK